MDCDERVAELYDEYLTNLRQYRIVQAEARIVDDSHSPVVKRLLRRKLAKAERQKSRAYKRVLRYARLHSIKLW